MKMLMSYQREELERLRVCAIEQATTIERLDDEMRKIKEAARDAMGLVKIGKKAATAWANTDGYHQAADIINLLCGAIEKISGGEGDET
jgi:hypothetical protein